MKSIVKTKRIIAAILCAAVMAAALPACADRQPENPSQVQSTLSREEAGMSSAETSKRAESETGQSKPTADEPETVSGTGEKTRAAITRQLAEIETAYTHNPDHPATALQYAQALFSLGDFDKTRTVLEPLLKEKPVSAEAIYLTAQIEYLTGNYSKAEEHYLSLIKNHSDDFGAQAEYGLQMVYYQTNEYRKAADLFTGQAHEADPILEMMKGFGDSRPYEINWNGKEETTIPFLVTDPLPIIPIEINGIRINALIDTGGDSLVLDETLVSALGVETIAKGTGAGGGGTTDIMWGKTDTLKLGDVEMQNIPTLIVPSSLFVGGYKKDGTLITKNAIIGTNILQQFIPVLDYESEQLVLIPRGEAGQHHLNKLLAGEQVLEEVPFVLADSHYMYAKGEINGHTGLNMFVDSGLESKDSGSNPKEGNEGIALSKDTMDLFEIPLPELHTEKGEGVLGGTDFEEGTFQLNSYGLGALKSQNTNSVYMTSVSELLSNMVDWNGFVCDALISHRYIRQHKWIINFDEMKMTFCQS